MQAERRVSGRFVEWLFQGAKGAPVAEQLRASGLDLGALTPDYPAERLPQWLTTLSQSLHPTQPRGEALRRMGFEAVRGVKREPRPLDQVMAQLPESVQFIGNFFDVSVREHGPSRYVAHFDDVACLPTFFLGVLQGVTSSTTERPPEVVWSPEGLSGARYELTVR